MQKIVLNHQRNISIQGVNDAYPEVYEDKPELEAATETFATNNAKATTLFVVLSKPRKLIYGPQKDQILKLRTTLAIMAGIGILIATRKQDAPKINMYKEYKRSSYKANIWDLYHIAGLTAAELAKEPTQHTAAGLTAEMLTDFQLQTTELGVTLKATDKEVKLRQAAREELDGLISENIAILRYQLLPYANLVQALYPAYFRDFNIARRSNIPRKPADKVVEMLTDISGIVTTGANGEGVANATVMITELNQVVTTDLDGYYLLEDVPTGVFTLSCHATGYKLPANEPVTVADTQSLQLNFSLEPEVSLKVA